MDENSKNLTTLIYCSTWQDESSGPSLEQQSLELQTYCALHGLNAGELIIDTGPYEAGKIRPGLIRLLERVVENDISHIAIYDVSRICKEMQVAYSFLKEAFDPKVTEIHIVSWNMSTLAENCQKMLIMFNDMLRINKPTVSTQDLSSKPLREKPLWTRLFNLLQDEKFTELLIKALFELKTVVQLSDAEYAAVHGGYDHLNLFHALGYKIKGENTDNTKLVTDVLTRYWDSLKPNLNSDLSRIIEGTEAAMF